MVNVGPAEVVLALALAALGFVAAFSAVVLVVLAAFAVVTPLVASLSTKLQRRHWHPSTSWLLPEAGEPLAGLVAAGPPVVRSSALMCSEGMGADVRVLTAAMSTAPPDCGAECQPMSIVYARLRPSSQLELPSDPDFDSVVYVLAGQGRIGCWCCPATAGQLVLVESGGPVVVASTARQTASPLEVLVFSEVRSQGTVNRARVVRCGPSVRQHIDALQAQARLHAGSTTRWSTRPGVRRWVA